MRENSNTAPPSPEATTNSSAVEADIAPETSQADDAPSNGGEDKAAAAIAALETTIAEQTAELLEVRTQFHKALDEFEKSKVRLAREAERDTERHKETVLGAFLDVADNLDRAIDAIGPNADQAVVQGVELVRQSFLTTLKSLGVTPMEADGCEFDPTLHDAISFVSVADPDSNKRIVGVAKKGYLIGDRPLRVASVAVGKSAAPVTETTPPEADTD